VEDPLAGTSEIEDQVQSRQVERHGGATLYRWEQDHRFLALDEQPFERSPARFRALRVRISVVHHQVNGRVGSVADSCWL
jgi:hypothetical protein